MNEIPKLAAFHIKLICKYFSFQVQQIIDSDGTVVLMSELETKLCRCSREREPTKSKKHTEKNYD